MAKKSSKDKKRDTIDKESPWYPNIDAASAKRLLNGSRKVSSILADQLGKAYSAIEIPNLAEALKVPLSELLEIKPPAVYTEEEYRKLQQKLQKVQKEFKEAQAKWDRDSLRQHLSRYFSEDTIDAILHRKIQLRIGRRCEITILNCDIRDFTRFANEVDPEYLTELLNKYLVKCTEMLHDHGGAVDKYLGDGILAYFGCFNKEEDHAISACKAAVAIVNWKNQNSIFQEWYDRLIEVPESRYLGIGIGIATGPVHWDYVGTRSRQELTIIGRHVNLASRLQSKAKAGEILISNITRGKVDGEFATEKVKNRSITLPGFEGKVDVFRLKSRSSR